jgi:hypothetical protein
MVKRKRRQQIGLKAMAEYVVRALALSVNIFNGGVLNYWQ